MNMIVSYFVTIMNLSINCFDKDLLTSVKFRVEGSAIAFARLLF